MKRRYLWAVLLGVLFLFAVALSLDRNRQNAPASAPVKVSIRYQGVTNFGGTSMSLFVIPKGFINLGAGSVVTTELDGTLTTNALPSFSYWPKESLGLESHDEKLLAIPYVSSSNSWQWLIQIHRRNRRAEVVHLLTRFEGSIHLADEGTLVLTDTIPPIAVQPPSPGN